MVQRAVWPMPSTDRAREAAAVDDAGESTAEKRAQWLADLAAVPASVSHDDAGVLVIDSATGRILASSPPVSALIGGPVPERVADLVAAGVIARPDLRTIRERIDRWRTMASEVPREAAHSWTGDLRIHPVGGPSRTVRVDLVHHVRHYFEAEALTVVLRSPDPAPGAAGGKAEGSEVAAQWHWDLYDHEMRLLAVDQRWTPELRSPDRFGVPVAGVILPEDLHRVLPAALEVTQGMTTVARYSVDFPRPGGPPLRLDNTLRVVAGSGALGDVRRQYVVSSRPTSRLREPLLQPMLTRRQRAVVRAVFAGLRPPQIADEQGVGVSTVRSHLADAYRALGVDGRDELVARYHPPGLDRDPVTVVVADADGHLEIPPGPPGREPSTERRRLETVDGTIEVAVTTWLEPSGRRPVPEGLLSAKEREVVAALFDGLRPTAIAERQGVGVRTVRKQLSSAFAKLDVDGQAQLTSTYLPPP